MKSIQLKFNLNCKQQLDTSNAGRPGPGDDDDVLSEDIEEEWIPQEAW